MKHLSEYMIEHRVDEGLISEIILKTLDAVFNGIGKVFDRGFEWIKDDKESLKKAIAASASYITQQAKHDDVLKTDYQDMAKSLASTKSYQDYEVKLMKKLDEIINSDKTPKEKGTEVTSALLMSREIAKASGNKFSPQLAKKAKKLINKYEAEAEDALKAMKGESSEQGNIDWDSLSQSAGA